MLSACDGRTAFKVECTCLKFAPVADQFESHGHNKKEMAVVGIYLSKSIVFNETDTDTLLTHPEASDARHIYFISS